MLYMYRVAYANIICYPLCNNYKFYDILSEKVLVFNTRHTHSNNITPT